MAMREGTHNGTFGMVKKGTPERTAGYQPSFSMISSGTE